MPSQFVGVDLRNTGNYRARIRESGKKIQKVLGTFSTEEEAARRYDEAAERLNLPLNFPKEGNPLQQVQKGKKFTNARSQYTGVRPCANGRFRATITKDKTQEHLGYYSDEEAAACKYDEAAATLGRPTYFPPRDQK